MAQWQLTELGIPPRAAQRRAETGKLHRVHHGVYAVGHRNLTYRSRWMAAALAGGPTAVLSHHTADALWDLRPRPEGVIDVTFPARGRRSPPGIRIHAVRTLAPEDVTRRQWIPVTTVARTLLDYAELARPQQLRLAVEAALDRDLLDSRALEATLARNPGRRGTPRLREVVEACAGGAPWTQSELERRFLAFVRESGLPDPTCNVIVAGELVDCWWPEAMLAVELDSYDYHRGRRRFEDDRRRDAVLQLAGCAVVRVTQRRLEGDARRLRAEVRAFLGRRAG